MLLETYTKTGISLKKTCGWDDLIIFLEKITSWACQFKSGLSDIFHWCAHSAIFYKSLFNSYAVALASGCCLSIDPLMSSQL